ncbi:MAG: hypothetical protein ACW7DX_11555, partial [Paraglaciecola chathamensis]
LTYGLRPLLYALRLPASMVNRSPDRSAAPKSLGFTHIWPSDKSLLLSGKFESPTDSLRSLKHTQYLKWLESHK